MLGIEQSQALVLSYSNISKDSRVLRQVDWLASDNHIVDAAGLGSSPKGVETYISITPPGLGIRLLTYIFLSSKLRGLIILQKFYKSDVFKWISEGKYDTVILNDLDFLGVDEIFSSASKSETPIYLDLHEYFLDSGGSPLFRALHGRYYKYLLSSITSRFYAGFITVSSDIASSYAKSLGLTMVSIENIPHPVDLTDRSSLTPNKSNAGIPTSIELVYHGNTGKGRGLYHLVFAMKKVRPGIVLNLVLTGSKFNKKLLILFSKMLRLQSSVRFWPSVLPAEVVAFISKFDVEVIFYPPPHSRNVLFSFPNKFFEALSAGTGIIVGPSPSMSKVVDMYQCGMTLQGWGISDLRNFLNLEITRDQVIQWKANTSNALREFSFDNNKQKFLSLVTGTPKDRVI